MQYVLSVIGITSILLSSTCFAQEAANVANDKRIPIQVKQVSVKQMPMSGLDHDDFWMQGDPFMQMNRMHSQMRQMMKSGFFEDSLSPNTSFESQHSMREVDTYLNIGQTPSEYVITVDVPGVHKDDLSVEISEGVLTVSGRRESVSQNMEENDNFRYQIQESSSGSFRRSAKLPKDADSTQISARHENGVLEIHIARLEQAQAERKVIPID